MVRLVTAGSTHLTPLLLPGWTKCWVIFALAALLDLALPARLHQGRLAEMVKIAFLAWCLLPLNINGSDLLFDFVVAPVHWVVTTAMDLCRPACQYLVVGLAEYVVQPSLETGSHLLTLVSNNIRLVVSATPGQLSGSEITEIRSQIMILLTQFRPPEPPYYVGGFLASHCVFMA